MRDGEPNIYGGIMSLLAGHETGLRTYATAFLTFNVIAFPIVFASNQPEAVKVGLSVIGMLVHPTLVALSLRELRWVRTLRRRLGRLEELDQGTDSAIRERLFSDPNIIQFPQKLNLGVQSILLFGLLSILLWAKVAFEHYLLGASFLIP